jgi:biopolymer transport protein ExbD
MKKGILVLIVCVVALAAWRAYQRSRSAALPSPDSPYVKIWVSKEGKVDVDGKPAELSAIGPVLATLAQKKGVVLYGRESAAENPHPNAMEVIKLVTANRLPIRMCTQPDFRDGIRPDGKLKF